MSHDCPDCTCKVKPRDHERCHGCGFTNPDVEAGGIYHCPNPFCSITGAWHVRDVVGFQTETPAGGAMTPLGVFLMSWAMEMVELCGGKVPKHLERFRDKDVLMKPPKKDGVR